jgi:hypothetical protein
MSQEPEVHLEIQQEMEKEKAKQNMIESLEEIEETPQPRDEGETRFFKGWKIVTGFGDQENMKKIIDSTLRGYHQEMNDSMLVVFGGNSKAQYPDVQISGSSFTSGDFETPEPKFFSMIIPSKKGGEYRYFLRKGLTKAKNESLLELNEAEVNEICKTSKEIFFPYLESLQGKHVNFVKEFNDKLPSSVTLREGKTRKIIFKIDEGDILFKKGKSTVMPNMSVRVWEFGNRNGWFATKPGVTLSCYNFFLLVNACFENFVPDVKTLVNGYFSSMKQMKELYAQENDEMMDDVDEPLTQ